MAVKEIDSEREVACLFEKLQCRHDYCIIKDSIMQAKVKEILRDSICDSEASCGHKNCVVYKKAVFLRQSRLMREDSKRKRPIEKKRTRIW